MNSKSGKAEDRKLRADALRNRERLLATARAAFSRSGANVNLDEIAKEAGLGIGTLYRHFPTRDVLLEEVYRSEVERLAAAEREFSTTLGPIEALRAWMLLFVDYIEAKRVIAPALNQLVGGPSPVVRQSVEQIQAAIDTLVQRAIATGHLKPNLDPVDLLRALVGVSYTASSPEWRQSAIRLVDILIAGSRNAS